MSSNVVLSDKLQKELINVTKKNDALDAIKELVYKELIRKRNKYMFVANNLEKKYNLKFADFEKANRDKKMDYEKERDYLEWDMAITVLEDIKEEIKNIE